jgi:hypothetical protein
VHRLAVRRGGADRGRRRAARRRAGRHCLRPRRKRHAKTGKTGSRHLRELLAEGRLPECWIPPPRILECRALLETCHDLRAEHTAWVQRVHAVFSRQGAPALGALRTGRDIEAARAAAGCHLSPAGQLQVVATALEVLANLNELWKGPLAVTRAMQVSGRRPCLSRGRGNRRLSRTATDGPRWRRVPA